MTVIEMTKRIGQQGDALFHAPLKKKTTDGRDVQFHPAALESDSFLTQWLFLKSIDPSDSNRAFCVCALPAALVLDIVLLMVKFAAFPFAWLIWRLERAWMGRKKQSFACPLCTNPMRDPLVYCPKCGLAQSRLEPTVSHPFIRPCPCGGTWWSTLGQFTCYRPMPLVCRDLSDVTGCFRRHPAPDLAGRFAVTHAAIAGSSIRSRHAMLGHLFDWLQEGIRPGGHSTQPATPISSMELDLGRSHLRNAFHVDTSACEMPGKSYSLAMSFLMISENEQRLLSLHNINQSWLLDLEELYRRSLNWRTIKGLIFVLDPVTLGKVDSSRVLPQAEVFSRLYRVIEQYCHLLPGTPMPHRVAVVLPVPSTRQFDALRSSLGWPSQEGADSRTVQDVVRGADPAFHALLRRCARPDRVAFFGGPLPPPDDLTKPTWVRDVLRWVF